MTSSRKITMKINQTLTEPGHSCPGHNATPGQECPGSVRKVLFFAAILGGGNVCPPLAVYDGARR